MAYKAVINKTVGHREIRKELGSFDSAAMARLAVENYIRKSGYNIFAAGEVEAWSSKERQVFTRRGWVTERMD